MREVPVGSVSGINVGFVEYLPQGYAAQGNWPVVIFLHGLGEVGNGASDLKKVRANGPPKYVDGGKQYPFVMLSPQTGGTSWTWVNQNYMPAFLDYVLKTYKVDPKRVYVTGLSLGGGGAWELAKLYPSRFAAVVPICGAGWPAGESDVNGIFANRLPIWTFHGTADTTVSVMIDDFWVSFIGNKLGATVSVNSNYPSNPVKGPYTATYNPAAKNFSWTQGQQATGPGGVDPSYPIFYTRIEGSGHSIWDTVYQDSRVFEWMLKQKLP